MRGVSHDLKNPLGAALGYAELLADDIPGTLNDRQREIVLRLRHLITAAVDTITDLLELSRAEAGRLPLRFDPTDVPALAREALEDYRAAAAAAGLTVECIVAEPLEPIATDSSRVRQIVGNLLSNAIKYTPAPGRVVLTVARSDRRASDTRGEWLLISVADSGPGIPPAYRERVFEEFVRVPSGEDHARGAGVGLAISRRVARLLGGELTLASGAAGGAIFTLRLPIHRPGRVAGAVIAEAASPGAAADAAIDVQADGA
jgi:signal transduction histidine kinase